MYIELNVNEQEIFEIENDKNMILFFKQLFQFIQFISIFKYV